MNLSPDLRFKNLMVQQLQFKNNMDHTPRNIAEFVAQRVVDAVLKQDNESKLYIEELERICYEHMRVGSCKTESCNRVVAIDRICDYCDGTYCVVCLAVNGVSPLAKCVKCGYNMCDQHTNNGRICERCEIIQSEKQRSFDHFAERFRRFDQ